MSLYSLLQAPRPKSRGRSQRRPTATGRGSRGGKKRDPLKVHGLCPADCSPVFPVTRTPTTRSDQAGRHSAITAVRKYKRAERLAQQDIVLTSDSNSEAEVVGPDEVKDEVPSDNEQNSPPPTSATSPVTIPETQLGPVHGIHALHPRHSFDINVDDSD